MRIREEVAFTKGRIIVRGKLVTRGKAKRAVWKLRVRTFRLTTRRVGLGRLGMRCSHLWRRGFVPASFLDVGIFRFADMAEFHFPVLEIRNDNQISAHR